MWTRDGWIEGRTIRLSRRALCWTSENLRVFLFDLAAATMLRSVICAKKSSAALQTAFSAPPDILGTTACRVMIRLYNMHIMHCVRGWFQ